MARTRRQRSASPPAGDGSRLPNATISDKRMRSVSFANRGNVPAPIAGARCVECVGRGPVIANSCSLLEGRLRRTPPSTPPRLEGGRSSQPSEAVSLIDEMTSRAEGKGNASHFASRVAEAERTATMRSSALRESHRSGSARREFSQRPSISSARPTLAARLGAVRSPFASPGLSRSGLREGWGQLGVSTMVSRHRSEAR